MTTHHLSPVWTHLTEMQPVRAERIFFYDADGTQYIDFTSGIGVMNTGHSHPRIVQAIQAQAAQLIFGQMNIVMTPAAIGLANVLNEVTPAAIDSFFFANSGAEAVEGAVKLARQTTGRRNNDGMVPEAAPSAAQKPDRAGRNGRNRHRTGVGRRRLRARPARLSAGAAPAVHAARHFADCG